MRRPEPGQLELPLAFRQQQAIGHAHLALGGKLVTYTIKRSLRRRAISILVDEDGVRVGAPWDASQSAIERLLHKHAAWVLRKLDEWQVRRAPPRQWVDGEQLMLLGAPFTLRLRHDSDTIRIDGPHLVVGLAGDSQRADPAAGDRVAARAGARVLPGARRALPDPARHPRAPAVLLSSARTRWGSCHSSGRIHLNWRLVQMPARLLDYVVAHEVAHLVEMNHSKRFWRAVERLMPDYAVRRRELRRDGHRYLLI